MKKYTDGTQVTDQVFGRMPSASHAAAGYVTKLKETANSLEAAAKFMEEYANRLGKTVTMNEEQEASALWSLKNTSEGAGDE